MNIYTVEVIEIKDDKVAEILHNLGSDCFGLPNDCYFTMTFFDNGDDDDWTNGYVTAENKNIVENWLSKNKIPRDKEFLIQRYW